MPDDFDYSFEWEEDAAMGECMYLYVKIRCGCGNRMRRSFLACNAASYPMGAAKDMTIVCGACHAEYEVKTDCPASIYCSSCIVLGWDCSFIHLCAVLTPRYITKVGSHLEELKCSLWTDEGCRLGKSWYNPPTPIGNVERSG